VLAWNKEMSDSQGSIYVFTYRLISSFSDGEEKTKEEQKKINKPSDVLK